MHLADLDSYLDTDQRLCELPADADAWARKAILNVAGSGKFSRDRTIAQSAAGDLEHKTLSGTRTRADLLTAPQSENGRYRVGTELDL
jgi:hypothetical protein